MNRHVRFLSILGLLLTLALSAPAIAQDANTPPQVGLRPDAPTYALHGPYWVGTMQMQLQDGDRTIPITLWYPALNPENQAETITYEPIMKWTPMPEMDYPIAGHALLNATPAPSDTPYPLFVFSHGLATSPAWYSYLLEHVASYGFVVIAPDHLETIYLDVNSEREVPATTVNRPHDISKVIDFAETLTTTSTAFENLIDMDQIAVGGHSYGGYTSLAAAGARFDLAYYDALCIESADDPALAVIMCGSLVPGEAEMAQAAGFDPMPEGLWPSMGDPRVKAIVPMAGDAYLFGEVGLAEITIPMLALGGTLDDATPYAYGSRLAYDNAASDQKALATFDYGNHYLFLSDCTNVSWLIDLGFSFFCSDSVWDVSRAHDLTNHFVTAFLLDVLKGDADAAAALAPDAVSFPGITYEAQGF